MTLRNPSNFSAWRFFLETPGGQEFFLEDFTLTRLVEKVERQLAQFDKESPGFTSKARSEAKSLGLDWERYLTLAIQHQICMRADGMAKGLCWRGAGDKIHEFMKGIDRAVDSAPAPLQRLGEKLTKIATKLVTGKSVKKLGGCMSCGGRKTFSGNDKNLGRVNKLNKL